MKNKKFILIFFLCVFSLPVISYADLKPAYSFADGNGRAWTIEEGSKKRPDIGINENGQAWAICNGRLYRANPEGLIEISHSETGIPSQFASSPNGKLYILWKESDNHGPITITSLSKGKIKRITSLDLDIKRHPNLSLYVDSAEGIWITGQFPTIYLWIDNKLISHEIKQEQFILRDYDRKRKWKDINFLSIYPIELSNKMVVFWSRQVPRSYDASLDGFITFSDGELKYIRGITSLSRGKVASLVPISNGLFGVAVCQGRYNKLEDIFKVDIKNEKAFSTLPANHPLANFQVIRIFADKEKTKWVLTLNKHRRLSSSLWQIKGNNIDAVIENIETGLIDRDLSHREICYPLLVSKNGDIWLGTAHSGAWAKLKENNIWQHVDWQSGFPLHSIRKIKEDRYGNIWFCGYCSGGECRANELCCLKPEGRKLKRWVKDVSSSNWRAIPPIINMHGQVANEIEFDQNGNPWAVSGKDILCRFDADKGEWVQFPLEKDSKVSTLSHDNRGRIWMFNSGSGSDWQAAIFEDEKLSYFPSSQAACELMTKRGEDCVIYSDSRGHYNTEYWLSIKDGKACFLHWGNRKWYLNYFDGRNWKLWKIEDIDPSARNDRWRSPPFFDKDGMLRVNIEKKNWRWDGEKWKAASHLEGPIKRKERLKSLKYNKQKEIRDKLNQLGRFANDKVKNVFETDGGLIWAQTNCSLCKTIDNMWIEVDKNKHPLMSSTIKLSRLDRNGNLYIKTPHGWFVRLADRGISPETLIETKLVLTESLPISFSFSGKDDKTLEDKLRFSWSLDEAEWSSPSYDKVVSFDWLQNGEHILKVKALDEELNYDPMPAVIRFIVKIDPKKLLADNLEMLKSSDYNERESAVRNLVRIGKDALPELKKMRASTQDNDLLWWIDVVIQQIEHRR